MVVSCLSTGFGLTFYRNVLLCVLLYRKEIIPEELFPLYLAVTYWHLDLQVLISTTDFPLGVNINYRRKKKCCCISALQSLYHRPILVNPLIMDKLSGCLMLPSSQKCRAFIRMAPSSQFIPCPGRSYHPVTPVSSRHGLVVFFIKKCQKMHYIQFRLKSLGQCMSCVHTGSPGHQD